MKSPFRDAAVALGWTTLALTGLIEPMVGRGKHLALYHWDGSPATLFGPVLFLFFVAWLCVAGLLLSAERAGRWRLLVCGALMFLLPWLLVNAVDQVFRPLPWLRFLTFSVGFALLTALVFAWRPTMQTRFEKAWERTSNGLLLLAFSGAFCLGQLGWFWWCARDLNAPVHGPHPEGAAQASRVHRGRVIWIVFDELSYQQLFADRFPGLKMPAFDALAAQSAVLTHVIPAGSKTDLVLPALIMGKPVEAIRASAAGELYIRETDRSPWTLFPQHDTVFQDALNRGYTTSVAGWFNPYCRILPEVLDHCFWRMYTVLDNGLGSDESFTTNVRMAVAAMRAGGLHDPAMTGADWLPGEHNLGGQGHLADYKELLAQGQRLLADSSANFVLLHLPVPHPGGIFDRRTGQFALEHTSYVDNLALADQCLAALRAQLEGSGEWDPATVVVMGDHSWRTDFMWRPMPAQWTTEDERASHGGHFDNRPAYLVKLPEQKSGLPIDVPFDAVKTRALLDGLLAGQWKTPEQVAVWLQQVQPTRQASAADPSRF